MRGARTVRFALAVAGVLLAAALTACGGGGGGSAPAPTNQAPTANAGPDQISTSGSTVTLSGAGSTDSDGSVASYSWLQTAGPAVALTNPSSASPTFCAPVVANSTPMTFSLAVTDNGGASSATSDSVTITVNPSAVGVVAVSGQITFARVPIGPAGTGLSYINTRQDPARGVTVQAMCGAQQVLASGTTNAAGHYTLPDVPANANVSIRAVAELVSALPSPSARWQVRVLDDDNGDQVHSFAGTPFNSSSPGGGQNLAIPSGWNSATRTQNGPRAAAPFAILDTVYTALLTIQTVEPSADFPPLNIDWGPSNAGGRTFYRSGPGTPTIVLSGEAGVDTDEYDQHVIAHEFGHYVEDHFSRADNIGGPHGSGDRLDVRVAFGEAFGYAFAGIVLNDPMTHDTFGASQSQDSFFLMEQNVWTNPGWFSEASNWSILWDLFDEADDGPDTIALGLAPLWTVLKGPQRTTEALTTVFSFITELKLQLTAAERQQVDQIVGAQNIVANTIYGDGEMNTGGAADALPLFTTLANGVPQTIRSSAPFGGGNKLANHRFLRLNLPGGSTRFTVTAAAGRDVDLVVYQRGSVALVSDVFGNEDITTQLPPGNYVLDVYDCENAECEDKPTYNTAPVDITVTTTH